MKTPSPRAFGAFYDLVGIQVHGSGDRGAISLDPDFSVGGNDLRSNHRLSTHTKPGSHQPRKIRAHKEVELAKIAANQVAIEASSKFAMNPQCEASEDTVDLK